MEDWRRNPFFSLHHGQISLEKRLLSFCAQDEELYVETLSRIRGTLKEVCPCSPNDGVAFFVEIALPVDFYEEQRQSKSTL